MTAMREDGELPRRRSKRLRKESSGELSIEELFPDDMAYDADVEAVYPDVYEEPESDTGSVPTPHQKLQNIDEELAARMKHLGHERSGTDSPQASATTRGQKRRSLHEEVMQSGSGKVDGVEVVEIVERLNVSPPKKRIKRNRSSSSTHESDNLQRLPLKRAEKEKTPQADSGDTMDTT